MPIIPNNKQWTQVNDGDSLGNIFASWNVDLKGNRGSLQVSKPLKNVFDSTDDEDFSYVAQFVEYRSQLWAIASEVFNVSTSSSVDVTDTSNWSQDSESGSPDPGNAVTDAVFFDSVLLVQDGDDIKSYNGSTWSSWWKAFANTSPLSIGESVIMKVGPTGNLYIVDDGNKVHSVETTGNPNLVDDSDTQTLDFSATPHIFKCATTTSSRIWFGSQDTAGDNAIIVEWDMAANSRTANRIHNMGVKQVLCLATYNDTPIAILSDGSIKYYNGSSFTDWPNAKLPILDGQYLLGTNDIIHKNGWAIIDDLPHFLINPTANTSGDTLEDNTSNPWYYPAGIYCLDPQVGLYCRYAITDGTGAYTSVRDVGALFTYPDRNTKFFASYEVRDSNSTTLPVLACEDTNNTTATQAWLTLQPQESVQEIIKQVTSVQKKLESGDEINLYYTRDNPTALRVEGTWADADTFNTTTDLSTVSVDDYGFVKSGKNGYFFSKVAGIDDTGGVNEVTFADSPSATAGDTSVIEFLNFRKMGSVQGGKEIQEMNIPDPKRSRQVWILVELKQAAGNNVQLDYLITS